MSKYVKHRDPDRAGRLAQVNALFDSLSSAPLIAHRLGVSRGVLAGLLREANAGILENIGPLESSNPRAVQLAHACAEHYRRKMTLLTVAARVGLCEAEGRTLLHMIGVHTCRCRCGPHPDGVPATPAPPCPEVWKRLPNGIEPGSLHRPESRQRIAELVAEAVSKGHLRHQIAERLNVCEDTVTRLRQSAIGKWPAACVCTCEITTAP
ncbi:hypothetical protein [Allokutzneria sp. NRRL B-24872]|uniref:hypothetical protein n=1 Tax=Allokutzneria sp. NRRL B-24872 TaxID=1137961 RepID=UPI000A378400|nr:hypothetical protein [Allokutzneria sp. NRRL B-24872]